MKTSSFGLLRTMIAAKLRGDDAAAFIPEFIALAESDIQAQLSKQPSLYEWATATTAIDNPIVDASALYKLHGASINGKPLRIVTPGMIRPNSSNSGQPDMLCFEGNSRLRFYPTPDAAYVVDVLYTPIISPALAGGEPSDDATNWILLAAPTVYYYGALSHADGFLPDSIPPDYYAQKYSKALSDLIASRRHGDIADSPDPLYIGMLDNDTWSIRNGI
jgi:hypothetical protein